MFPRAPKRPRAGAAKGSRTRDRASWLAEAHQALVPLITESLLDEVTALVPPAWFGAHGAPAYVSHLLAHAPLVPEVIRA